MQHAIGEAEPHLRIAIEPGRQLVSAILEPGIQIAEPLCPLLLEAHCRPEALDRSRIVELFAVLERLNQEHIGRLQNQVLCIPQALDGYVHILESIRVLFDAVQPPHLRELCTS